MRSGSGPRRERAAGQEHLLHTLLAERDGLLVVLDRVLALQRHRAADPRHGRRRRGLRGRRGRDVAGRDPLAGRQPHRLAAGPRRAGRPGRRRPGARPRAARSGSATTSPRAASPTSSTAMVSREDMSAMLAVPILEDRAGRAARTWSRWPTPRCAARASSATTRCAPCRGWPRTRPGRCGWPTGAALGRDTAVAAERQRMQASLHDSVGAMLFSIGAQVRDLRSDAARQPAAAHPAGSAGVGHVGGVARPCARRCSRCPSRARSGRCRSSSPSTAAASKRAPACRPGSCSSATSARWTPSGPRC